VYNGKDNFLLNKKNNTIKIYAKNVLNDFTSLSAFFNSIITLKNAIPLIINDAEIEKYINDTSVATKQYHVITLILKDKGIGSFGKFQSTSIKRNFFYKILIEKNTYLPFKIIQTNNAKPDDFAMTTFENIIYNAQNLPELSWYYSTYLNEYKQIQEKQIDVIKVKSKAPEFVLPFAANSTDSLKLSGFVGNVVLLEFWEKNCGYCISAVPKLNSLINKFKEVKFKIFGINVGDSRNDIELFYKRNQPLFKSVVADTKVVEQYGITGYPTIVVIDKKGAVLYAGNMDIEKIESVIESGLR
jgi:thiol-disulfide isomerase/thioredoxin